jgi:hypothetical protein
MINTKGKKIVPNPLLVVYNFLIIQIQVVPLILTHLVVLWWLCVNHILNLICNLGPLLYNTSSIQALGSMISLCVAYFACLHMTNASISLCSQFTLEFYVPLLRKVPPFELNNIHCKLIHLNLVLVSACGTKVHKVESKERYRSYKHIFFK